MTPVNDPIRVTVARKRREAEGICSFELVDAAGAPLPPFEAGAHIDVRIPGGGATPLLRQYSLANAPGERHRYLIAVLDEPASRGGSRAMHRDVREGDVLQVGAPRNLFALAGTADREQSLLLAGGIGITPILSMAETLAQAGADFALHYCARSADRVAFGERLAQPAFAGRVHRHLSADPASGRLDLARLLQGPSAQRRLYVCGPERFLDAVTAAARAAGWADEHVRFERFSNTVQASADDGAFEVRLARSGRTVPVAADQSVVAALAAQGIELPVSCEQGVCGTCLTRVLEGVPDHKDVYLTPDEQARNDQFTPCCSRSRTPVLVLDL